jgi:hypothetical protein
MSDITVDPRRGELVFRLTPEAAVFLLLHLPADDGFTMSMRAALGSLKQIMQGNRVRCEGSGIEGIIDGPLLKCPVCDRVIGICPPNTLPEHEAPVYNDGTEGNEI